MHPACACKEDLANEAHAALHRWGGRLHSPHSPTLSTVTMVGTITGRHLLMHPARIIQHFGPRCYLRCVWRSLTAGRPVTFLECIDFESEELHRGSATVGADSVARQVRNA